MSKPLHTRCVHKAGNGGRTHRHINRWAVHRITTIFILLFAVTAYGQSFTTQHDTVYAVPGNSAIVYNNITNLTAGDILIHWKVKAYDFPQDWLDKLGICDKNLCYTNMPGTTSLVGDTNGHLCHYPTGTGNFDMVLAGGFGNAQPGTHWLTVQLTDTAHQAQKLITFIVSKYPLSIAQINREDANPVSCYPDPAGGRFTVVSHSIQPVYISVTDNSGKLIYSGMLVPGTSRVIDISHTAAGVYYLYARSREDAWCRKISIAQ